MPKIKEGFKGELMLSIPEDILQRYRKNALIAPLYIRKMGYFPKVKYHYVQKDNGGFYEWYTPAGEPMGSGTFRGEAGVLYHANYLLREWAKQQSK